MTHIKLSAVAVILLLLIAGHGAHAQTSDPFGNRSQADTSISYKPPAVYVTKINLDSVSDQNPVKGKFMIWNNEKETIDGLLYRIDLLDPLPKASPENGNVEDNAAIYDRFVSTDQFSLLPNERKEIDFIYSPPALPSGSYRLQITATNARGRDMGWWDADLNLTANNSAFLKLITGPLLSPEYPERTFPAQAGPNISPGKSLSLNVVAQNDTAKNMAVVPVLYLYEFDLARGKLDTIKDDVINVPAKQTKNIRFSLIASKVPRVYYGILVLEDPASGKKVSNLAEYRFVVKGEHAEVMAVRVINDAKTKGQSATVRVALVGSADAFTKTKVDLKVEIKDQDGALGSADVKNIELSDGVYTTQGPIKLSRDLKDGKEVVATLNDAKGNEIDRYSVPLNFSASANNNNQTKVIQIGTVVIILGAVLIYLAKITITKNNSQNNIQR